MPTIIGVVFFICGAYFFLLREDGLFGLLIIASAFEASSAIDIGERGVQPYYLIAVFIILKAFLKWSLGFRWDMVVPHWKSLLLFGSIAIASSFILPVVFAGIPVYDPKVGIDPGLFIRPPLKFGLNNVGQAGFLACHIATAYSVLALDFSPRKARGAFMCAFYIIVALVLVQSVFQFAGVRFPDSLIRNNPGYAITSSKFGEYGARNSGPCTEPSVAGAFLVLFCCGFLAEYLEGKRGILRVILALVALLLVASSGSILALCLIIPIMLLYFSPFRPPWFIRVRQLKRYGWILLFTVLPLVLVLFAFSNLRNLLIALTVSKGDTSSFFDRTTADLYALHLLVQTHWLGVGLGSNRASSLLTTLLSDIGILGALAFCFFYVRLFIGLSEGYEWLKWGAFGLLLTMFIGVADVTMPLLWIPILFAIQFSTGRANDRRQRSERELLIVP
jgi:hypothetical protein